MTPTFTTPEMKADDHANDAAEGPLRFPCTPPQERCWFLEKLKPGNTALNVAVRWEIRGKIDASTIEQALRTIIQRHEILRTRLVDVDGTPMQEVEDDIEFKLSVIDLTNLPEADRTARAGTIHHEESKRPFDLSKAPLIRATAIRTAPDRTQLMVLVHQAAFDGWSIKVLGAEVGQCIAAIEAKRAPGLPDLPLQYGDYALWLHEFYACSNFEAEKTYWQNRLTGAPYFEIETDHPRGPTRTPNGALVTAMMSREAGDRMEAAAKAHGISMFNLGCAVIGAILHRISGENDVIFGTQVAGRDDVDLESLIGVFINNLVLRLDTSGDPTFKEFLGRAEEAVRGALTHQKLPFHRLVELMNPPRDLARTPLISINVILQRAFLENAQYETFELAGIPSPSPGAFYDLNFQMVGRPEGWRMSLEYNTDLFDKSTAQNILDGWKAALEAVSTNANVPLSQLPAPAPRAKRARGPQGPYARLCLALQSHPDVAAAVVSDKAGGEPYAYVEPAPTTRTPLEALPQILTTHLQHTSPDAAKVKGISVLFRLPRGANGEIDESALPAPMPRAEILPPPTARTIAPAPSSRGVAAKVAQIWKDVLGVEAVPPRASFFDLGGHSLLAVRMLMRIEEELGHRFGVATLFTAPVFEDFVAALVRGGVTDKNEEETAVVAAADASVDDSWKTVVLQDKGDGIPIVAINNLGTLYALAQRLGETRPSICIRAFDPSYPFDFSRGTFEAIAEEYVQLLRRVQPHGPYILFGLCVHGVLAVEIARQLREAGEDVPLISVVNCWEPTFSSKISGLQRWRIRFHDIALNFQAVLQGKRTFLAFLGTYSIVHRSGILRLAHRLGLIKEIPTRTGNAEHNDFLLHLHRTRDAYRPQPHNSDMLLFRDDSTPKRAGLEPTLGWKNITRGRCDLKWIPIADLRQPNDPGVAAMVEHLQRACEEADKRRK